MENIIEKFYRAFSKLDAEAMASCYHADIQFEDPAFGILKGEKAVNMWRMLCASQKGKDFKIEVSGIEESENTGKANWEAYYTFSKTGRKVHNKIDAEFKLKEGQIIMHRDHFDLYRWSRQALGISGLIFGWTSIFKTKLRTQTNHLLSEFEKSQT